MDSFDDTQGNPSYSPQIDLIVGMISKLDDIDVFVATCIEELTWDCIKIAATAHRFDGEVLSKEEQIAYDCVKIANTADRFKNNTIKTANFILENTTSIFFKTDKTRTYFVVGALGDDKEIGDVLMRDVFAKWSK